MTDEEFRKYINTRYEPQIEWYSRRAKRNHNAYLVFQWLAVVLSALTPILIVVGDGWLKWLAVAVAALVAISTSAVKTFKYQEQWINYRTTCETLKKEIHLHDANIHDYAHTNDKKALFVDRVESLRSRENTLWVYTHDRDEVTTAKHAAS